MIEHSFVCGECGEALWFNDMSRRTPDVCRECADALEGPDDDEEDPQ